LSIPSFKVLAAEKLKKTAKTEGPETMKKVMSEGRFRTGYERFSGDADLQAPGKASTEVLSKNTKHLWTGRGYSIFKISEMIQNFNTER
jgi:hypothetical protein